MKKTQIDTENDKKPAIFQFSKILCTFFSKFAMNNFVDCHNETGQQGKNMMSSRLFRRVCLLQIFCGENVLN